MIMKLLVLICLVGAMYCKDDCKNLGRPYDHVKKICCMGYLMDRDVGDAKCCEKEIQLVGPQGEITSPHPDHGIPPTVNLPQVYNSRTHICCRHSYNTHVYGRVLKRVPNARCCERNQYNHVTQLCHKGYAIIDIPYHNNDPKMCGDKLYDGRRHTCCSDYENNVFALHNRVGDGKCCKSVLMHGRDHICCGGVVHHRPANGQCCGDHPYDPQHYLCCGSHLPYRLQPIPFYLKPAACCKGTMYSTRDHNCCNGVVSHKMDNNGCCNKRPYDVLKSICCAGQVKTRGDNSKCCGNQVYDKLKKACCNGQLCPRPPNALNKYY